MRTRQRRRFDIGLIAGGSLLVGVAAFIGGVAGNTERIERYWTTAAVDDTGSAEVVEVIDYNFGTATDRHGIIREIPGMDVDAQIAVSSPTAPDQVSVTPWGDGVSIRVGDPDSTVSGKHRYQIDYQLPGVRRGDTVDWEAVGDGWDVGMGEVEIHLVTPFELDEAICIEGNRRSPDSCDIREVEPGHLAVSIDSLGANEGVSVEGRVGQSLATTPTPPSPPVDAPDDPGTGLLPPAGTAVAAAALAAVPTTWLVRRAGREHVSPGGAADAAYGGAPLGGSTPWPTAPSHSSHSSHSSAGAPGPVPAPPPVPGAMPGTAEAAGRPAPPRPAPPATAPAAPAQGWSSGHQTPASSEIRVDHAELAEMATIEFAPPSGITPAQGGVVLEESVTSQHKVAWLIQAAVDGVIDLEGAGRSTTIRRIAGAPAAPDQQAVFARMFARGPFLTLGKYDKDFASGWSLVGSQLEAWRRDSGLWDRAADARKIVVRVLGFIVALVGLGIAALGGVLANRFGAGWLVVALVGGLLAGGGLAAAIGAWELHVRTAAGSALWLRVESFRRFLAESEGYHADEAAKRGVLREYTAWALAVGEIDRWSRAVQASTVPPDTAGVQYAYMAPLLISSTSAAATAPSSSGSGGGSFGGGSIGGGAGGGGGGSW
ncbi:MAG TPA: DUF2207 domain-containing protein [Acidimicrobiales bacterium]|nr:DUF2207 domain-containing protein [Acidimicrobiales bacterium]